MAEANILQQSHPPRYEDQRAVIRFSGEVNADRVFSLCDEIDLAVQYYCYPSVRIEIDSPGGELNSLRHYIARLRDWRRQGARIETLALTRCSSAAAYMLSLGDVGCRMAMPRTTLLYHNTRLSGSTEPLTSDHLGRLKEQLTQADAELTVELLRHLHGHELPRRCFEFLFQLTCILPYLDSPLDPEALELSILHAEQKSLLKRLETAKSRDDRQCLRESLYRQLTANMSNGMKAMRPVKTVEQLRERIAGSAAAGQDRLAVCWLKCRFDSYRELFGQDEIIGPRQAIAAGLIDSVKE